MKLRDKMWLWGQSAGTHQKVLPNGKIAFGLGKYPKNTMTPAQGLDYFGIPNVYRVVMGGHPAPPFDSEAEELKDYSRVVWSVLGDLGSGPRIDLDEVLRLKNKYPNLVGGVLDDLLPPMGGAPRLQPDQVREIRKKLHQADLDLRVVIYEPHLEDRYRPWIDAVDVVTFWTWWGSRLTRKQLEAHFAKLFEMCGGKPIQAGCYFWNYVEERELTELEMKTQLDFYHELLAGNRIQGMVVCSNCIADLGLPAGAMVKEWIARHGEEFLA